MSDPSSNNENGEGPSTPSLFHSTLQQHSRIVPNTTSIFDTPKNRTAVPEKETEPSDWEYDSHDSFTSDVERYPGEDLSNAPAYENHTVDNPVDMGEAIEFAFPHNSEYDLHCEEGMFDDGLDSDETECSDASSNYEELPEPNIHLKAVKITTPVEALESDDEMEEGIESEYESDESYEPSSDEEDLNKTGSGQGMTAAANGALNIVMVQHTATSQLTTQLPVTVSASQSSPSTILSQVLTTDLELKQQEKQRDASQWKLLELQEALRNMELHIVEAEAAFQEAEAAVISQKTTKLTNIVGSGLSVELFEAYQDFCESLQPEFGMRDGFSITCYHAHKGSYIDYDPEFLIFKGNMELDYNACNFRCEPGKEPISRYHPRELVDVVHFWPLRCPEPRTGLETAWGEQYPELYGLALQAAKQGSEAAIEMLMKLPLPDGALSGWMFEYQFEKLLEREPVVSRRWVFKQAQSIDMPMSQEEKNLWLQRQIAS